MATLQVPSYIRKSVLRTGKMLTTNKVQFKEQRNLFLFAILAMSLFLSKVIDMTCMYVAVY